MQEAVQVWVIDRDDRVLQQRKLLDRKGRPGQFGVSAGGRCEASESPADASARLLQHELGLTVPAGTIAAVGGGRYKDERVTVCIAQHGFDLGALTLLPGTADEVRAIKRVVVLDDWRRDGPYAGRRELACRILEDHHAAT